MSARQTLHVTRALEIAAVYFRSNFNDYESIKSFMKDQFEAIINEYDWDSCAKNGSMLDKRVKSNDASMLSNNEKVLSRSFNKPIDSSYHLDIYLLEMLFNVGKSSNKRLKKLSLDLILADLNLRKLMKKECLRLELLIDDTTKNVYTFLLQKTKALYECIRLLSLIKLDEFNPISEQQYNDTLKKATSVVLDCSMIFKRETLDDYRRSKYQNLVRNSGLFDKLIEIIHLDYDNQSHKLLFKSTIDTLNLSCWGNIKNQKLLLPYVDKLIELMKKSVGTIKLLTQVISRHRELELGQNVMRIIFEMIDRDEDQYHLLQFLRTFVVNEKRILVEKLQIDVLKGIFHNKTIRKLH